MRISYCNGYKVYLDKGMSGIMFKMIEKDINEIISNILGLQRGKEVKVE